MTVKNCTECAYYHTCQSYYGGTGCKMEGAEQARANFVKIE